MEYNLYFNSCEEEPPKLESEDDLMVWEEIKDT